MTFTIIENNYFKNYIFLHLYMQGPDFHLMQKRRKFWFKLTNHIMANTVMYKNMISWIRYYKFKFESIFVMT